MKKFFYLPFTLFLFSCAGDKDEASTDDTDSNESIPNVEIVDSNEVVIEGADLTTLTEYRPENADGKWQIDDYVEIFTEGNIYIDSDAYSDAEDWNASYYEILDIKGGYANISGGYEGWSEYVMWRMKDGYDLLGTKSASCGGVCDYNFRFYKCKGEEMKEVSMAVLFPQAQMDDHANVMHKKVLDKYDYLDFPEDKAYLYKFPQKGTDMQVDLMVGAEEVIIPLVLLSWNKERFDIKKKYTELPED